jgi:hypothetical protein
MKEEGVVKKKEEEERNIYCLRWLLFYGVSKLEIIYA